CFTYIDYVEAMRLSANLDDFNRNLKDIRYKDGNVTFENRNHFFSDWPVQNSNNVKDVTYEIGGKKAIEVEKNLNLKSDGSKFLPGIPVVERKFYYIPSSEIDNGMIGKLHTGDYVGIYTDIEGLDVTHTGIVIKKDYQVFLRHASSRQKNNKVVDEDLIEYIQNTPGMVIFRPQ
ncbi:MAG: N-acetylmuramoyl-L-alanine amidase-like domain-containing protein, partial [Thermodesulfobacteriota bacterium]